MSWNNVNSKRLVTISFTIALLLGGISLYTGGGQPAQALQVPGLEVEKSFHLGEIELNSIQTIPDGQGGYSDIIAGWARGADPLTGETQFYAIKYTNGVPEWYRSVLIINQTEYGKTMFNSVSNYVFAGSTASDKRSSSLIVSLEPSMGALQAYSIFDPGTEYGSRITSIGYSEGGNSYVVVGTANSIDWFVPEISSNDQGMIALLTPTSHNISGPIMTIKGSSGLNDVAVYNDPSSPYYGYIVAVGYLLDQPTPRPLIVVLNHSMGVSAAYTVETGTSSVATSVSIMGDEIIVGGYAKNGQMELDGFIASLSLTPQANVVWLTMVSTAGEDRVEDVFVQDTHIAFTGVYNGTSTSSSVLLGELHSNGTLYRAYSYAGVNAEGKSISVSPVEKLHVVGSMSSTYPSTLTVVQRSSFTYSPQPNLTPANIDFQKHDPVYYHEEFNVYNRFPIIDQSQGYLMGLYLVTGEFIPEPITVTTSRPTANVTTTPRPPTTTVTGPGPQHTGICIDISTGTTSQGTPDTIGTPENPLTDYPDWGVVSPQHIQARASSFQGWQTLQQSNAVWISAYTYSNGAPIVNSPSNPHPDAVYSITFTLQTPSILNMTWTADNAGYLYVDGVLVQNTSLNSMSNYTTLLQAGTHTLSVKVVDSGIVSGLYVSGSVCAPTPVPINSTKTPTDHEPTGPQGNSTGTGGSCPCQSTIAYAVGGMAGISAAAVAATHLLSRRR